MHAQRGWRQQWGNNGKFVCERDRDETEWLLLQQAIHPISHRCRISLGVSHDGDGFETIAVIAGLQDVASVG